MKLRLIGLTGKAGCGKDTAADYLVSRHGYKRLGLADALKSQVASAYKVSVPWLNDRNIKEVPQNDLALKNCSDMDFVQRMLDENIDITTADPLSPRWVMQRWGTEYRKAGGKGDYWTDLAETIIKGSKSPKWVITDVRFDAEARWVNRLGGYVVPILRPGINAVSPHVSEKGVSEELLSKYWMCNDGDKGHLYAACRTLDYVLDINERYDTLYAGRDES